MKLNKKRSPSNDYKIFITKKRHESTLEYIIMCLSRNMMYIFDKLNNYTIVAYYLTHAERNFHSEKERERERERERFYGTINRILIMFLELAPFSIKSAEAQHCLAT
jgi:hypothetical protein